MTAEQLEHQPGAADDLSTVCHGASDVSWSLPVAAHGFAEFAAHTLEDLPGGRRGFLVLATVDRGLPRSQLALAQQLGIDKNAMTSLLDVLEAAGFIRRRPDPADRRARQLVLTDTGARELRARRDALAAASDRLLQPLTPDEALTFRLLLERVAVAAQVQLPCVSGLPGDDKDPCG